MEILGQSSNSHAIQPHLLSLYDNINKLVYSPTEYDRVLEIVSKEGEGIPLEHSILCVGGVENWLNTLLNEAKNSVNLIIMNVSNYMTEDSSFSLLTMVDTFPSQVTKYLPTYFVILFYINPKFLKMGLVGLQMLWTYYTENAVANSVTKKLIMKQTNKYFIMLLNSLIDCTTKNLTKMERLKYETLITIHVHQRFEHI